MEHTDQMEQLIGSLLLELRRGTITLHVLSCLEEPRYGYALVQRLEEKGAAVEAGTLYPLLRRLEKQGLLESAWETGGAKPRKYYALTGPGRQVLVRLRGEWKAMVALTERLLEEGVREE